MKGLGARTNFRYVEERSHFDLYTVGDDRWGAAAPKRPSAASAGPLSALSEYCSVNIPSSV